MTDPTDGEWLEREVTLARFTKARRMADILEGEGVTTADENSMDDRAWELTEQAARVRNTSIATRALTFALLKDREERKNRHV